MKLSSSSDTDSHLLKLHVLVLWTVRQLSRLVPSWLLHNEYNVRGLFFISINRVAACEVTQHCSEAEAGGGSESRGRRFLDADAFRLGTAWKAL